jgi:alkaline phosphatase
MKRLRGIMCILLILTALFSTQLWAAGVEDDLAPAKNVIVLIGDGMGFGAMELGRIMEYGTDGQLNIQRINTVGLMTTNPADGVVTDSAAAGTALAASTKTLNGSIGVDADKNPVESIAEYYQNFGKSIGLISTNTVDDATPAAFGAHVASRDGKSEIVRDYYDSQWDVILGGGTKYFGPDKQNGVDMIEKFIAAGYTYVTERDALAAAPDSGKLLGLFTPSYMNYISDLEEYQSNEPSLREMTMKALDILSKDEDGFFLMSEGARIDHAAHAGDATAVWLEMIEFDNTVQYCLEWAAERGDTLVVVTADHQTMALAPSEVIDIEGLKNVSVSAEYMAIQIEKNSDKTAYTVESIQDVFTTYAGIELSEAEAAELQGNMPVELYSYQLGWEIGSVLAAKLGVGLWSRDIRSAGITGGHSAAWVPVFAQGPGEEAFMGSYDNTNFAQILKKVVR